MDCEEFNGIVEELEHELPMNAVTRAAALQHAESCASCRARLAESRLLSLGLRSLAKEDESLRPPEHLESLLRSAFRERTRRPSPTWRKLRWAGAVAAIAVTAWLAAEHVERKTQPLTRVRTRAVAPGPASRSPAPPQAAENERGVTPKHVAQKHSQPLASRATAEAASEFVSLPYAGNMYPVGDHMLVRVQLPASAPALLGLPIPPGADTSGSVTADVVLGQDGVARAIRFVPPAEGGTANQSFGFQQNQSRRMP